MQSRIPSLHLIQAFDSVVRNHSFTKAAEELNVTRSTISHRVQALEDFLKIKLFERTTRKIILSTSGAAYYLSVKQALIALDHLGSPHSSAQSKKKITISSPPTFANHYLLPQIRLFLEQYPHVEIAIDITKSQLNYEISNVDFDIRYGTGVYPRMLSRQITRDQIFPVCSPSYAYNHNIKTIASLKSCTLLRSYLEPWEPWFKHAGLDCPEPNNGHRFEDLSLLYNAAANSLGVALGRESLVKKQIQEGTLIQLFDLAATPKFQYYAIINPQKELSQEANQFLDWINI
ncbi:LysR substrate-binding domain-containing protein [Acinetobacter courvalinii]|uniref:LysR substrate-binding domain-containing protein n=1 Tax=Acinetobacter courvalinii TaxID=280147 RepID=UPI0018FFE332|nr:LysR substrate-binding domain-containing protein [Acinetobacter courvalinii]MBJ8418545.1 LysR family transcriptional regulator [Acinetobacter courvalinii]